MSQCDGVHQLLVASANTCILSSCILQLTLEQAPAQIASEYYTKHEMAQFRKPKKKKKIRRLKADDLLSFSVEGNREVYGHRCVTIFFNINMTCMFSMRQNYNVFASYV